MHILFIDDNDDFRTLVTGLLHAAGHSVHSGRNGREALRLLTATPTDLLITDIIMPEVDGLELIFKLRRQFPVLPIIAMSGSSAHNALYLGMAQKMGAIATLTKPFSVDELLAAIARVPGAGKEARPAAETEEP